MLMPRSSRSFRKTWACPVRPLISALRQPALTHPLARFAVLPATPSPEARETEKAKLTGRPAPAVALRPRRAIANGIPNRRPAPTIVQNHIHIRDGNGRDLRLEDMLSNHNFITGSPSPLEVIQALGGSRSFTRSRVQSLTYQRATQYSCEYT